VPRCAYETFERRDRWFPAARLICTDNALSDARTTCNVGLRQLGAHTCSFQELPDLVIVGQCHVTTPVRIVYEHDLKDG